MQFECSSKFLVLKISLLFYIAVIFAFTCEYEIIALDLFSFRPLYYKAIL